LASFRAKQLQPLLDLLCNLPDAWKQPRLLEFLNISMFLKKFKCFFEKFSDPPFCHKVPVEDKAHDLVTAIFESTLEDYKFHWGGAKEVMFANSPGGVFCFALFYRIREYWAIIKDKATTSKPAKVLCVQQMTGLLDKTEKHVDDLLEVLNRLSCML